MPGTQLELSNTLEPETIAGPAAGVIVSGGGLSRVFQVDGGVTASISGMTITGGSAGGGLSGGGLYNDGGTVTLTDCTLSGNSAGYGGGGLFSRFGTTTLTDCTITSNSVPDFLGFGGGLFSIFGTTTLTDCTVTDNSGWAGGGLYLRGDTTTLTDCTFSGNSATFGGGIYSHVATVTLVGTIVAGNAATNFAPDVSGTFASQGHNLIGNTNGSSGWVGSDLTGTSAQPLYAMLAPLGNYGGPTETMALLARQPGHRCGRRRQRRHHRPARLRPHRQTAPSISVPSRARALRSRPSPAAPRRQRPSARLSVTRWR